MRIPYRWIWRAAIFIVVLILFVFYNRSSRKPSRAQAASPPAVPVVTTVAKTGDQPIYLNGLGLVTAFKSVTLRTRVDGELLRFAVREGQMVSQGDLIAEIDPGLFRLNSSRPKARASVTRRCWQTQRSIWNVTESSTARTRFHGNSSIRRSQRFISSKPR